MPGHPDRPRVGLRHAAVAEFIGADFARRTPMARERQIDLGA